ncbi:RNA-directed DNA polymerase from mobile element jockey [Plakobranchus ocellatus]|uniref:RNA-directed DNA polymerase from mobile element jockey n=1 Tax=Plakobranchus ocellatus TaxID=259542 RepID=A0AAV4B4G5_9GAST|nr:RNA-directed DNA polymerase from mobile element jockey [Plakobranchus ocellatus]
MAKKPCTEAARGAVSVASKRKAEDLPTLMSVSPFAGWSQFKKFMVISSKGSAKVADRPYIPLPMHCYKCQRYGHGKDRCKKPSAVCVRCGKGGHVERDCSADPHCVNCKGDHTASSKPCPKFLEEQAILRYKAENGGTFQQARKAVVVELHKTISTRTFASAVKSQLRTKSVALPKDGGRSAPSAPPKGKKAQEDSPAPSPQGAAETEVPAKRRAEKSKRQEAFRETFNRFAPLAMDAEDTISSIWGDSSTLSSPRASASPMECPPSPSKSQSPSKSRPPPPAEKPQGPPPSPSPPYPFTIEVHVTEGVKPTKKIKGPDGVCYQFLRHLPESCLHTLLKLFSNIWTTGDIPPSWREASVVPIPKPGKDPSDPSNYRPIALTSCLCKTLERMWVSENGFRFSVSKTICVHFHRQRIYTEPALHLDGQPIPVKGEAKFLGVVFDSKLNFSSHVKYLKKKCLKALNLLCVVGHTDWGADRATLLKLYRTLVRSKLDYGSVIYGSPKKHVLRALDPTHHQGLRIALGPSERHLLKACTPRLGSPLSSISCICSLVTHRIFKRCLNLLTCEQSTRIFFNTLEGNYALCLMANLIQLGYSEMEGLVENTIDFMSVMIRLLQNCNKYVQNKKSNLTHWHPVLGWFSQKTYTR